MGWHGGQMKTLSDDRPATGLIPVKCGGAAFAILEAMAAIPEEELWLQSQRSPHTRCAYKEDVRHFMRAFGITTSDELRQVGRAAVIAWVRQTDDAQEMPRTVRRRLSAPSSLFRRLIEQHLVTANPVRDIKRPSVERNVGVTAAFDAAQARAILDAPDAQTLDGLCDRAILSVLFQAGPCRAEVAGMKVKDLHINIGFPSLRYIRKGGKQHGLSLHPQTAQRLQDYLKASRHGEDLDGPLFRAVRDSWKDANSRRHLDTELIDRILRKYTRKALGITCGFSVHSCRATFATRAVLNDSPLEDVQKALGHADSRTTKFYDKRGDNPERSATFFANYPCGAS